MNTVGESIALSTLLYWITKRPRPVCPAPTDQEAMEAAALLAAKAAKTGACGFSAQQVREFWPKPEPETEVVIDDTLLRASIAYTALQAQICRELGANVVIEPQWHLLPPEVQQIWVRVIKALDAYDVMRVNQFAKEAKETL